MAEEDTTAVRPDSSDAAVFARTPAFPVLDARIGPQQAVVDGRTLCCEDGQDPREAAVAALAARAGQLRGQRGSVRARVSSVDADGTVVAAFSAVVTAEGDVVDTTGERATQGPSRSRRWLVAALVAGLVAVVGVVVSVAVLSGGGTNATPHRPAGRAVPTGTPTVLPQRAPQGWSSVARWSAAIADGSHPIVTGGLAISVTDSAVQAHRLADGGRVWQAELPSDAQSSSTDGGLHVARVAGRDAVVAAGDEHLYWWPLAGARHQRHTVGLPSEADVSFAGPSPLVTVPGQHARVIDGDRLADRVVPAGATALAAADQGVVAADTAGRVWWLTAARARFPGKPISLQPPKGAGGHPQVAGVAGRRLVTSWPAAGKQHKTTRVVALNDAGTGRVQAGKPVAADGVADAQWQSSPAEHQFGALGDVVIDARQGAIGQVRGFTADTVLSGVVYGHDQHQRRLVVTGDGRARPAGGDTIPVARSGRWALVTVEADETGGATRVYALPAGGTSATSQPSGAGGDVGAAGQQGATGEAPTPTSGSEDGQAQAPPDTSDPTPTGKEGQ